MSPAPDGGSGTRPGVYLLGSVVVLVAAVIAAVVVVGPWGAGGWSTGASVDAGSTAAGYSARSVTAAPGDGGRGWRPAGAPADAWIELTWSDPREIGLVTLERPGDELGAVDGVLSFGDGSNVQVRLGPGTTTVPVTARSADRVRLTVAGVGVGTQDLTLRRFGVDGPPPDGGVGARGDEAVARPTPSVTSGAGSSTDPRALVDGTAEEGREGAGADWSSTEPLGSTIGLSWGRPRELTSVTVVGSERTSARLAAATIIFSDGSELPVGGVLPDPRRPTVAAFMPRVTTSLRLRVDRIEGDGPLALAELRTGDLGSTPRRTPVGPFTVTGRARSDGCPPAAADATGGLVVLCPLSGSEIGDRVAVRAATTPGYTEVRAEAWPAEADGQVGPTVTTVPDAAGTSELVVDTAGSGPGPLTLSVTADGPMRDERRVLLQVYRPSVDAGPPAPTDGPVEGRTLVYAEEFRGPLSSSRTGAGADYAAAKPTDTGAEDFGRAIFAEPASPIGATDIVGGDYLHIGVRPTPPGYGDSTGRAHVGGLLASARAGGSGFSAQYGYFEARMLGTSALGTWPAFWTLPADNLVSAQPVVAEIDAMEAYGHDPQGVCHSTHDYRGGDSDLGVARCGQRFGDVQAATAWHTYGVSVDPTGITYFIDGRVVAAAPQVAGGGSPMFFLVDLALGGGWPIDLSAERGRADLLVDFVRVYV